MSILFVCHETGRTQSLIAIARNTLSKTDEKIIFLVVGQAAKKIFSNLSEKDPLKKSQMIYLSDFFSDEAVLHLENNPMNSFQRETLENYLFNINITKAIIGAPSWHNALIPFQVAEDIANLLTPETGFIYDGDYYKEEDCAYWTVLAEKSAWQKQFTWLASLPKSKQLALATNPSVHVEVVGDPSIDITVKEQPITAKEKKDIQKALGVDTESLLLVSGTKVIEDDEALLESLLQTEQLDNTVRLRLVLHPGILDSSLNHYVSTVLEIFKNNNTVTEPKLVIDDSLKKKINEDLLGDRYFITSSYTRDQMAKAADGLACSIPGTHVIQASMRGIPAYYHMTEHDNYFPEGRLLTATVGLNAFVSRTMTKHRDEPLTKESLGVPQEETAVIVAKKILALQKQLGSFSPVLKYGIYAVGLFGIGYMAYKTLTHHESPEQIANQFYPMR